MIRPNRSGFVAVLLLLSCACAPTRVTSIWKDPEAKKVHFEKILVAVMTPDLALRTSSEDQLVMIIGQDRATPSYKLFPGDKAPDKDTAVATIKDAGYDAVLIMKEAGTDVKTEYVSGSVGYSPGYAYPYYGYGMGFGPYWSGGWYQTYSPGYMQTNVTMRTDVIVFDIKKDKAIWASQNETKNPSSARTVIDDIVKTVRSQMKSRKFIP